MIANICPQNTTDHPQNLNSHTVVLAVNGLGQLYFATENKRMRACSFTRACAHTNTHTKKILRAGTHTCDST